MASSPENLVDLTSDSDDEVRCTGSITRSAPKRLSLGPSNPKPPQIFQAENRKQRQLESTDNSSTRALPECASTLLCSEGTQVTVAHNLMNSKWDGFAESSQRDPSNFRSPSPFTKAPGDHNYNSGTTGLSSQEHQRKRIRDGSLSLGSKRSRYFSPNIAGYGFDEADIEIESDRAPYDIYRGSPSPRGRKPTEDELDHAVIVLDHDDDLDDLIETSSRDWTSLSKKRASHLLNPEYILVDLDDNEDRLVEEVRLLAPRESSPPGRSGTVIELRNLPITPPWVVQESEQTELGILNPGDVVELKGSGFLRISIIMKNLQSDAVRLRGCRLERTRELNGILPKKLNELYWTMEIELDDPRPPMVQGMEEIDLVQVRGVRKLRITNKLFPSCSFRETGGFNNEKDIEHNAPCTMRWRYSCKYLTARDRWHNKWSERCVEHLKEGDLFHDDRLALSVNDAKVRSRYRGDTVPGGAYRGSEKSDSTKTPVSTMVHTESDTPTVLVIVDEPEVESIRRSVSVIELSDKSQKLYTSTLKRLDVPNRQVQQQCLSSPREVIDLSDSGVTPPSEGFIKASKARAPGAASRKRSIRSLGQKYTYGDCFCGAGGATRGALMAGLKPIWGFDMNNHACTSWHLNFPDATIYQEWADQFIQRGLRNSSLRVDILHLSPPCQYFSPAHTTDGKDDEMNMASLFACGNLLDVAKPRVATLEQTFGIVLLPRFQPYFNALILMFTDRGFSVRWKIAQLQNWGLPQRRQRLIIIASCPGEVLPEFPPFTHASPKDNSDLPHWVSVDSVIRNIPRGAPNHDIELMEAKPLNCIPWSGDSIAPRCITTHGGQNYHPSGKRGFTNREYACLQGFPMNHQFSQVNVKKQIGNAVPPCIAKVLFSWIKRALEKADGIEPQDAQSEILNSGNFQTEAIVLD